MSPCIVQSLHRKTTAPQNLVFHGLALHIRTPPVDKHRASQVSTRALRSTASLRQRRIVAREVPIHGRKSLSAALSSDTAG
jgi:hypothetical protein